MTNKKTKTTYLKDYKVPPFLVESLELTFDLYDHETLVQSQAKFRRNQNVSKEAELLLNGENLKLLSIEMDGKKLNENEYVLDEKTLTLNNLPDVFTLKIQVQIHPEKNTELSGLYRASHLFCTQCEAQGFRRITYFPDRPDVMTQFTTIIKADKKKYPLLLSNGNCVEKGEVDKNRHWVKWIDPFKKPSYLFALVAGNLVGVEDHFLTQSGRLVTLKLYVEWENQDKCAHAISALKRAMIWDEKTYGREYDLDIYMIVAVNDFNMGAMENKGLNIFNSKYILARPETATDVDFYNIDAVVGHEYFHNWSGNRVTCRDWFQLSLKEGLTVFREHQFSQDITQSKVSLIEDADLLRSSQFVEDAGPMAHPIRPNSYIEIDNFYTSTVYEKGAEVIRMIQTILGKEKFRKGMDLYFERFDGQAVTCDDFVKSMEDASGIDLAQFRLWYSQAGTPEVTIQEEYNQTKQNYSLTLTQNIPDTPGQSNKHPQVIPIAVGLLDRTGQDILAEKTRNIILTKQSETFIFDNIKEKPVLSALRNFSAPVKIKSSQTDEELIFLLEHDSDDFNRWDAGQKISERLILKMVSDLKHHKKLEINPNWFLAYKNVLLNKKIDLALKAELLTLPSLSYLLECMDIADIDNLYAAKKFIIKEMAKAWNSLFLAEYELNLTPGIYQYTTDAAAKRTYKNLCLDYLLELESKEIIELAMKQLQNSNNMTDEYGALCALSHIQSGERDEAMTWFYHRWEHDPLVVNKWLRVQALAVLPNTLEIVKNLMEHPSFDMANPNKVYSLLGAFSANLVVFHDKQGGGYRLLADSIIQIDQKNPQVASRLIEAFMRLKKFDEHRQALMRKELERIKIAPKLSNDVYEKIIKALGEYKFEIA